LYAQPLTKEEEHTKSKRIKGGALFFPPAFPLCHSLVLHLGFNTIPLVVAGSFTQLKMHRLQKVSTSPNDLQDYFSYSFCEALENNQNPHNFKTKLTQVFARLSLHLLFI